MTLSVNPDVVSQAKRYAKKRGVSVSQMVEAYLSAVARPPAAQGDHPVLNARRGTLKSAKIGVYRKHLADKYR